MFYLQIMVKRSKGKKQQDETEKQQQVIVSESNLFKDLSTKAVRNYD